MLMEFVSDQVSRLFILAGFHHGSAKHTSISVISDPDVASLSLNGVSISRSKQRPSAVWKHIRPRMT